MTQLTDVIQQNPWLAELYREQYGDKPLPFAYEPGQRLSTNVYDATRLGPVIHGYEAPGAPNYAQPGAATLSPEEYQNGLNALSKMLPQLGVRGF